MPMEDAILTRGGSITPAISARLGFPDVRKSAFGEKKTLMCSKNSIWKYDLSLAVESRQGAGNRDSKRHWPAENPLCLSISNWRVRLPKKSKFCLLREQTFPYN